ncbi:flagellar protein FlaG [Marinomonas aquimarina]|uniref:Flagellar protein FlaG n=1 Tax=Marinomonas aquimarina TaxID=295068 RepID=A0A1A8T1I0_9GAMM|nr:flagellar protein FlaG [Marinomonas aquimarina]SBS25507.1 flagellar protein FlaG [Marinomonas aquimarina]
MSLNGIDNRSMVVGFEGSTLASTQSVETEQLKLSGSKADAAQTTEQEDAAALEDNPAVLQKAVEDINSMVESKNRQLRFSVDDSSGKPVITVLDSENEDVIREIPTEEVRRLAARIEELQSELGMATGLLVDSRV